MDWTFSEHETGQPRGTTSQSRKVCIFGVASVSFNIWKAVNYRATLICLTVKRIQFQFHLSEKWGKVTENQILFPEQQETKGKLLS